MQSRIGVVGDLVGINAVRELQDGLHVRRARLSREGGARAAAAVFGPVSVAPPCDGGDVFVNVRLALGTGVAGHGVEVARERDLGVVDLLIVGLERRWIDFGIGVAVDIVQRRCPLNDINFKSRPATLLAVNLVRAAHLYVQYTDKSLGFSPDGHPFCSSAVVGRSFVTASEP